MCKTRRENLWKGPRARTTLRSVVMQQFRAKVGSRGHKRGAP